jgi:hypothetical protein
MQLGGQLSKMLAWLKTDLDLIRVGRLWIYGENGLSGCLVRFSENWQNFLIYQLFFYWDYYLGASLVISR